MPLVKRAVEPSALCRQSLPNNVKTELECVTNNTLSGVIYQLSSISGHAEDLFGELFSEANSFYTRASKLQDRIDNLNVKVKQLDSTEEEVSLHDINTRKVFRSGGIPDQQVVSRNSLSTAVQTTYNKADKPPPLQNLNQYRDDGKDALKIYTDPDYFFNLWRDAMQKEMRDAKEKRKQQRKKGRKTDPNHRKAKVKEAVPRSRMKALQMRHGVELVDSAAPPMNVKQPNHTASPQQPAKTMSNQTSPYDKSTTTSERNSLPPGPNDIPDFQPPSPPPISNDFPPPVTDLPEPPLPPPLEVNGSIPDPPSTQTILPPPINSAPPPPPPPANVPQPPPPPPVSENSSGPPANSGGMAAQLAGVRLNKTETTAPVADSRGGLLQAIRVGINLKKVEQKEKTAATSSSGGNDVASILARRIAVEFSDSESDSYLSEDDAEWDD